MGAIPFMTFLSINRKTGLGFCEPNFENLRYDGKITMWVGEINIIHWATQNEGEPKPGLFDFNWHLTIYHCFVFAMLG